MTAVVESAIARPGPLDLDWLMAIHSDKRLSLCTPDGGALFVSRENPVDERPGPTVNDAHSLVTELIRLARLGQRWEQVAEGERRPAQ